MWSFQISGSSFYRNNLSSSSKFGMSDFILRLDPIGGPECILAIGIPCLEVPHHWMDLYLLEIFLKIALTFFFWRVEFLIFSFNFQFWWNQCLCTSRTVPLKRLLEEGLLFFFLKYHFSIMYNTACFKLQRGIKCLDKFRIRKNSIRTSKTTGFIKLRNGFFT